MKYISPQTEKRKQQRKKRRKQQMLVCAVLLAVILTVSAAALILGKNGGKPSSSVQDSTSSVQQEESLPEEKPDSSQNQDSSDNNENAPEEKPKKKKQSVITRIKSLFAKTEPIPVTFPATVFGKTVEGEMNEIVSLSPFATEVILSSPSQQALVAVSSYCDKRGNEKLMTVGTPLIPDMDKIIQLKPDCLIIQTPLSENDRVRIEENGIMVLEMKYPESIEALGEIYRSVTAITHGADIAAFESERILADLKGKLELYTQALEGQNKLNAVMLFNTYGMIATPDTMEGWLLGHFFDVKDMGRNYMAENMEAVVAHNPQVIIAADNITEEQIADMGLGDTDAVANGRVYYVDIRQFENLSLKSVKTLSGIANQVYGSIIKPPVIETEEK